MDNTTFTLSFQHVVVFEKIMEKNNDTIKNINEIRLLSAYYKNSVHTERLETFKKRYSMFGTALKRVGDIALATSALAVIFPPLFIASCINSLFHKEGKHPVFFRQKRTGKYGKTFYCLKFCSMRKNALADIKQATANDPRISRYGAFLRKHSLDEVPQFINVLIGDMAIVGPRPHMLRETISYSSKIDNYMLRHGVKPGVTGYAQVTGFRGETKELSQMIGRVECDVWYVQNRTLWLDFLIIVNTPLSILRFKLLPMKKRN